jgi:hypothetical protein
MAPESAVGGVTAVRVDLKETRCSAQRDYGTHRALGSKLSIIQMSDVPID